MTKKTPFIWVLISTLFLLVSATLQKSSSGAPASHTGAPDDKTCATVGCHDDNALNSGTAQLSLSLGETITAITPGQTYRLKFTIQDKDVLRFGFQLLALTEKTHENTGQFIITDSLKTQMIQNRYALKDRSYVTYTFNGTDAIAPGYSEWTVKWIAPPHLDGPVTFYYAGVSANDDMSDKGDKTYTGSLTLKNSKL